MTNQMTQEQIRSLGTGFAVRDFELLWRAIGRLPFVSQDGPYAWRGVSDSSYDVQSSLHRWLSGQNAAVIEDDIRRSELKILELARQWGLGRMNQVELNDLQLLAILQHNGMPTRLLDVTANPLTALWFACMGNPDKDALLLAFNVSDYPEVVPERNSATYASLRDPLGWSLEMAIEDSARTNTPFLVRPSYLDRRMAAQEGFFLASACPRMRVEEYREVPRPNIRGMFLGPSDYIPEGAAYELLFDPDPAFTRYPQSIWSFRIPAAMKGAILPVLDSNFNRNAASLFPDYAGLREFGLNRIGSAS